MESKATVSNEPIKLPIANEKPSEEGFSVAIETGSFTSSSATREGQ
jgi:hypothetical protein